MAEYLRFTVDSALLRELGEKLVETVHLALAELVKNSYDADATEVKVKFTQDENGNDEIHIIDNGVGMNFQEVQGYWMRIATTNKVEQNISLKYGRPKTGAKGIGRFCCRRLGSILKLITIGTGKKKDETPELQKTEVEFFWENFEPGTNVTTIECPGKREVVKNVQTGTTLIIKKDLTDEFSLRGYNWLKRQLAVLAANRGTRRKGYEEDPGFNIILDVPDLEGEEIVIQEDLINAGWGTLTVHINNKHQAVCKLDAMGIGRKTLISNEVFPNLKDIKLKLGIMVDMRKQMRDTSVISKGTLKDILPKYGGVQVRYRGFRVYPYGDDDWLEIDKDRGLRKRIPKKGELYSFAQKLHGVNPDRVLLNMLSMRSYVGNVEIGDQAEGFEMKANREGFISSPAVDSLKEFVRYAIDWTTIYRDYYIRVKAKEESEAAREYLEEVTGEKIEEGKEVESAVNYIQKEIENIAPFLPEKEKKVLEKSVKEAFQVILKHEAANQEELIHLRLIASTSTLLLIFSHEVKALLGMLEVSKNTLQIIEEKLTGKEQMLIKKTREGFSDLKDRFRELLEMTSLVGIDSKREKPKQLALRERISRAVNVFQLIRNRYDINVDFEQVPNNIVIKSMLEAELYAILLNILSNSIKSTIAAGGNRKIEITAVRTNGKTVINFKDTGIGLHSSHYEEVFMPFASDVDGQLYDNLNNILNPEDKYIVGTGSGLGLSIVREIVRARNGQISFKNPQKNWSTELEIILP